MERLRRAVLLALLAWFASLATLVACTAGPGPGPVAAWQGARLYASGSRALERGATETAIADLEGAASRLPHASEIQNHLGAAYARAGRHADALAAFERAVALDCDNAAATRNLAEARAAHGRGAAKGATR